MKQIQSFYSMESFWIQAALGALTSISFVYDVITFPIYLLLQRPWKRRVMSRRIKVSNLFCIQVCNYHDKLESLAEKSIFYYLDKRFSAFFHAVFILNLPLSKIRLSTLWTFGFSLIEFTGKPSFIRNIECSC